MGAWDLISLGKKTTEIGSYAAPYSTYAPTIAPQTIDQRQLHYSPQFDYAVQIGSPNAAIQTKKEAISELTSDTSAEQKVSPEVTGGATSSTGIPPALLIGGAVAVLIAAVILR